MQSFFRRAILCPYNALFIVKINNSFSDYQQIIMDYFIDKILNEKNQIFNAKKGKILKKQKQRNI